MRKKISLDMSVLDIVTEMSEGNPGALTVMMDLISKNPDSGVFTLLHLDDMNIRGSQIWVGYKDYAGEDIAKFEEAVIARNPEMVNIINMECDEKAVTSGASFR